MIDQLEFDEPSNVPIESLRRYLLLHGWTRNENIGPAMDLFTFLGDHLKLEIFLPKGPERNDEKRASFGFAIESPLVPNTNPSMPGVEELAPLSRRIMQRLARGIKQVARAGRERDTRIITENYSTGFSANMCEDFVDLMESVSGNPLGFEFAFSPEWRPASDVSAVLRIELPPIYVELVKDAARQLRLQEFERRQTVVGRVVRLESENDPSDLFTPVGDREIMIQWNSDDFGQIRVRVVLSAEQYLEALKAYAQGQFVSISGLIDRIGRYWVLLETSNFHVVPQA